MSKKLTTKVQPEPEKLDVIKAPTKFNIELGGKLFTVFFGTLTFLRIKEERPELPSSFDLLESIDPIEAIPFLIHCGVRPEDRAWNSYEELLELYDECEDTEAVAKVLPGYLAGSGSVLKKLTPALAAVEALSEKGTK
ncbi:hypothetical protein SAMN04487996_107106 [Dyadobacter soli]|uniref:Uncharacterized protein n=1 Tax=Dyadobacter soli TaxID=659014 RepID=A0A1G7G370_9BACT|nr:hypothetical protein [Dyadobacter soli]SDE82606.1 hypothetical protein SAMN04487996_107106 [Dyadobacter soli]